MNINTKYRERFKGIAPKWLALAVSTSCFSLIFYNISAMPVAIPCIADKLRIPVQKMDWIINMYFLLLAILILPTGRLTHIFGIRRLTSLGFTCFILGSLWAGLSVNFSHFLIGRGIQGIGAALMLPAMGAHLIASFPSGQVGKAWGLNTGISSFFFILGPIIAGYITQYLQWQFVIFFNIPIALFGLFMTLATIPKVERKKEAFFDYIGALFLALAVGSITVVLMQGAKWGWTGPIVGCITCLGCIATLGFFIVVYMRQDPIIDLSFFRLRSFTIGTLTASFVQMISMVTVFWALYMQNSLNFSPTATGGLILLYHFPILFSSPLGGYLGDKWGEKLPVAMGFFLSACGLMWIIIVAPSPTFVSLIPPLLLLGIGIPLILPPCYSKSMEEIHQTKCAVASGVTLGIRQLSLTFGMSLLSALYSFMQKADSNALLAFRSVNMLSFIISIIGIVISLCFFSKKQ